MVFESIVVELINRYLGSFVENLDTSQLKIGIWGGDVVLNNLNLKESALDELDLPVKIKAGHIGKLTLKIPWKNLYTEPVVAELEGIYALAVPNIGIKYNEEKEKKDAQDDKQAKLTKIEEQKKLEEEKDKPKDPKKDSFAEKLATQVIKNLQVRVTSVHVRYEDCYTNPASPVSLGVTLGGLVFQTTDENWKETVIKEAVTQIHKLIRLDNLAVYWNSKAEQLHTKDKEYILESMRSSIAVLGNKPKLQYLFKPISAVAHLKMNTKPELSEFTIPKIFLSLVFDNIALSLTKTQYDDILQLLESKERMDLMGLNKKSRPDVPYKGNATAWWKHAYSRVLENEVQRRRKMWSWSNIKAHRENYRQYKELYIKKLSNKKLGGTDANRLSGLEEKLDLLNIVLARTQAEGVVAKEGAKKAEEKAQNPGWFGGWFGGGKKSASNTSVADTSQGTLGDIGQEFQKEFDAKEQAKLYKAIGYDEGVQDTTFPTEYVSMRVVTKLNKLSLALVDDTQQREVLLKSTLSEIYVSFGQRPSASAIRVDSKVGQLLVTGRSQRGKDSLPKIVASVKDDDVSLLSVMFETNPLDGECDSRARVKSNPLEIIYDATTINSLAGFFKPPEDIRLKKFSEAAMEKYTVIKEQTATGMMHAMEEKKYMDLQVDLMASYILVPATGTLKKDVNMLMLNLGSLKVSSEKNKTHGLDVSKMSKEEVQALAYDKFNISLTNIQLLFVQPGDSWQDTSRSLQSPMYILRPLSMSIDVEKCIFSQDPVLPQMRVKGELPVVSVAISDTKMIGIMKLVQSIPLPQSAEPAEEQLGEVEEMPAPTHTMSQDVELKRLNLRSAKTQDMIKTSQFTNFTALALSFQIHEVSLEVFETVDMNEVPLIKLVVAKIGVNMKQRTFDMVVDSYLGGIYLQHLQYKLTTGELVNIINTPKISDDTPLLTVNLIQADKKGPEFATLYQNTAQSITVQFETLDFIIHQSVILSLMKFAKKFESPPPEPGRKSTSRRPSISTSIASLGHSKLEAKRKESAKTKELNVIQLKLKGLVEGIRVGLCSENYLIMDANVGGIEAGLSMYKNKLGVSAVVRRIDIIDPDPFTSHRHIVTVSGSDVLSFNMMQYNDGTKDKKFDDPKNVDIDVSVSMGRAKVTFVNKFVSSLMNFLDNFSVAKAKLEEAGKAAKETSKNMAKNIKEHSSRLKLSVNLRAPLVIFPRNSKSCEVIMINLGDIKLENKFECVSPKGTKPGMAHIAEALSVELSNLRVSRGITEGEEVKVEINILEPFSFKVNLKRNLSEGWFNGIPDIALSAVLETVQVSLSFEDLSMIMLALEENLNEKASGLCQPHGDSLDVTDNLPLDTVPTSSSIQFETTHEVSKTTLLALAEEAEVAYTKVKVDFKLVSFILGLYKGSSDLDNPQREMKRPSNKHLGQISIQHLSVDFAMMSDQAMNGCVILRDISLDDMRLERAGGITKMIHPINKKLELPLVGESQEVINVKFTQDKKLDKDLKIHISSLHICVCMEFLMRVADFFTKAQPPPKPKTIQQVKDEQIQQINDDGKARVEKKESTSGATPAKSNGTFNMELNLEKPEIILVEDQMNPNTNSLIVDVGVKFSIRTNEDNDQMIMGSIQGLSLISCVYKNPDTEKSILSPCDITMICKAPGGKNHHVNIDVTDIILTISPSTIQLLSSVASGMTATQDNQVMETLLGDYCEIWHEKDLNNCSFWFTSASKGTTAGTSELAAVAVKEEEQGVERGEELILAAPLMIIKLEGGIGHRTVPLIIFESAFSAQVHDWSSLLHVESAFSIEMAYYNEKLGAWEPIIEPVVTVGKEQRKWELNLEVCKNEDFDPEDEPDQEQVQMPLPKMVVSVVAKEPLQLVVTKTFLDVLTHLGKVFNDAYQLNEMEGTLGEKVIPYLIKNQTGKKMKILLDNSFEIAPDSLCKSVEEFDSGSVMSVTTKTKTLMTQKSVIRETQEQQERKIGFQFPEAGEVVKFESSIKKSGRKLFTLPMGNASGEKYRAVCNVDAEIGQKIISFTSILKVRNHLETPVRVFYLDKAGSPVTCDDVAPLASLWLPLDAVYSTKGEIYFQPLAKEEGPPLYQMSEGNMKWKDVGEGGKTKELRCLPKNEGESPLFFNVLPLTEQVALDQASQTGPIITFNLYPTVMLHNLLPYDLKFLLEGTSDMTVLKAGRYTALDHASVNQSNLELMIPEYRGKEWSGRKLIKLDVPPLSVWSFSAGDAGKTVKMELGLHCKMNEGSFDISIYSPYWIINMSHQQLALKEDDKDLPFIQEPSANDIMMYFFKDKPLFGSSKKKNSTGSAEKKKTEKPEKQEKVKELKKPGKVQLKIGQNSDWSDKFSLDTVGSSGNVACKNSSEGNNLEVGVKIVLSASGLTKIVTFTPFYMLLNASIVPISVREEARDQWIKVEPGECKPLYPIVPAKTKDVKMVAQVQDSSLETVPFLVNKAHTTLLKLTDKYGGLNADCQVRESAMITTFTLYQPGLATVQVVNQTSDYVISFHQSGVKDKVIELKPMTAVLYTWDDPAGKTELMWSCGDMKKDVKGTIDQDAIDKVQVRKGQDMFWVSFLDGMQRVLMFTEEEGLAHMASGAQSLEQADISLMLGIHDMGLSLLNNEEMVEVSYMGITSSGVIWEEKKKRYKAMKVKDCITLEHAYQKYLNEKEIGKRKPGSTLLENKLEVDFDTMMIVKPRKVQMRRSFEDGMWMELKLSPHSKQLHAKINRLQLDNQLRHAVFPTVLSPMPPPKSVAAESVPKAFVELSLIMQTQEHSNLLQIKYFRVLIQEMNLKVDQGFLNAVLALFASGAEINRENEFVDFENDMAQSKHDLKEEAGLSIQQAQPNFYDSFHISPIKIHLSFSLQGGESGGTAIQSDVLNVFLQSVGVVLTDVQDVVFKLGYFERNHTFYDSKKLTNEFIRHYSGQAIKQMYVLILGLDVLGNPFGLLRGLGEGIEDLFYEPYQGAIQGPEEFAEGLALGVRSLFGHAVGGAAGAVSRITGTVGKGLAALTLDDDYQKKRREQMNKKPASAKEGFARGGKGLVMGVFDGVTGIVRKPVEGAKQEGVSGFFKGMGKGLVGVVTRPTSGVVDFASSSLEGIRRITDMNEDIHRLRPPRNLQKDGIIRPYIREEAEGYYLLGETDKGKYFNTDEYLMHVNMKEDGKLVLLITDRRLLLIKRGDIFGAWDTEWVLTYFEMKACPKQTSKGLEIPLKVEKKKTLFGGSVAKKDVHIADPKVVQMVLEKISKAMEDLNVEHSCW